MLIVVDFNWPMKWMRKAIAYRHLRSAHAADLGYPPVYTTTLAVAAPVAILSWTGRYTCTKLLRARRWFFPIEHRASNPLIFLEALELNRRGVAMRTKPIVALFTAAMLAGCVTQQERMQQVNGVASACMAGKRTMVEKTRCLNEAENAHLAGKMRYPDLMGVVQSQRILLASKVDRNEISEDEADAQMDLTRAKVVSEASRRAKRESTTAPDQSAAFSPLSAAYQSSRPGRIVAADKVPEFKVACRSADTGHATIEGRNAQVCFQDEQDAKDKLKETWSSFDASQKVQCQQLLKAGGLPSYVELLTCVEMKTTGPTKVAKKTQPSGNWPGDDYDVSKGAPNGPVIGRIYKSPASSETPWFQGINN